MFSFATLKRSTPAIVLALGFAFSANAGATTVAKADTEDLAHIADLIVVGEVTNVVMTKEPTSPRIPEETIFTHNAVRVIDTWKGDARAGDVIDIVDPGGIVDGKGFELDGQAGYKVGERVLLFLQPRKLTKSYLTLGIFLGKFTLLPNGSNGWMVSKLHWKLAERGQKFDVKQVPSTKFVGAEDLASFSAKVKRVVDADREAGIDGKWLPKYDHMGVGR